MNRRELLAGFVVTSQVKAKRQGPHMDQLFGIATMGQGWRGIRAYYSELFRRALVITGPVVADVIEPTGLTQYVFSRGPITQANSVIPGVIDYRAPLIASVLVPESLLKFWKPTERGADFPAGVPFVELVQ